MNLACLAGFDDDSDLRALLRRDQMMMHCATGDQRANCDARRTHCAVRQHDKGVAVDDGLLGIGAESI